MKDKVLTFILGLITFFSGLALICYHAGFWPTVGVVFVLWAHNLEYHHDR